MKKKLSLAISIFMLSTCFSGMTLTVNAEEPVIISSSAEFAAITNMSGNYVITNSFSITAPLGSSTNKFTGTITGKLNGVEGARPTITITINAPSSDNQGLVAALSGGKIENMIVDGSITAKSNIGGIVGQSFGGQILNCDNYANIASSVSGTGVDFMAGGIVGSSVSSGGTGTTISNCGNYGKISAQTVVSNRGNIGGIAGSMAHASDYIVQCSNQGEIYTSGRNAGGIAGGMTGLNATVVEKTGLAYCSNVGDVTALGSQAGGLTGVLNGSVIYSFNTGNVTAGSYVGGITGVSGGAGRINIIDCYNTGNVTATVAAGPAAGICYTIGAATTEKTTVARTYTTGTVSNNTSSVVTFKTISGKTKQVIRNFYLATLTATEQPASDAPLPLSASQMSVLTNYTNFSKDVWQINTEDSYGYAYAQLIYNPHKENIPLLPSPESISVEEENDNSILSFAVLENAEKYKAVVINNSNLEENIFYTTSGNETQINLSSAIKYNGSYTIQLTAIGDKENYGNSDAAEYTYSYTAGKKITITSTAGGTVSQTGTVYQRPGLTYSITVKPDPDYMGAILLNDKPVLTDIIKETVYTSSPIIADAAIEISFSIRPIVPADQLILTVPIETFLPGTITEPFTIKNQDTTPFQIKVGVKYGITLSIVNYYYGWTLEEYGVELNGVKYPALIAPVLIDSESGKYGILFEGVAEAALVRTYAVYRSGSETKTVYGLQESMDI